MVWIGGLRRGAAVSAILALLPVLTLMAPPRRAFASSSLATGSVSTLAGSGSGTSSAGSGSTAGFNDPHGMAVLGGYAYVGTQDTISRVDLSTGSTSILAGTPGTSGYCTPVDGGSGLAVTTCDLVDLTSDSRYLYLVDGSTHSYVRRVDPATGATSTIAQVAGGGGGGLHGIAVGPDGFLYVVAGALNSTASGSLVKIDPSTGAAATLFTLPSREFGNGIAVDAQSIYLLTTTQPSQCNPACTYQIEKLSLANPISETLLVRDPALSGAQTLLAAGGFLYTSGSVPNSTAALLRRYDAASGAAGNVAGAATGYADGTGAQAWFGRVNDVAFDGTDLYVADGGGNNRIRRVAPADPLPTGQQASVNTAATMSLGSVLTVAGSGSGTSSAGSAATAGFNQPQAVTLLGGYAYVGTLDTVSKVDLSTGATTILAGTPGTSGFCTPHDASSGTTVVTCNITDLTSDGTFLYLIDGSDHSHVRRVDPTTGATSTIAQVAGGSSGGGLHGIGVGPDGALYVVAGSLNNTVSSYLVKIDPTSGAATTLFTFPAPEFATGLAVDSQAIYVLTTTQYANCTPTCPTYQIEKLSLANPSSDTLLVRDEALNGTQNLLVAGGYLYTGVRLTDTGGRSFTRAGLRAYDKSTGAAHDLAGSPTNARGDGIGTEAAFGAIDDIASDGTRLLVADGYPSNSLREVLAVKDPAANGGPARPGEALAGWTAVEHRTSCRCGDPVDTLTGGLVETATDLAVPGRGPALGWTRIYSSLTAATNSRDGFGWTDNYGAALIVDPYNGSGSLTATATLDVVLGNGARVAFTRQPDSSYTAPTRVLATLARNGDGTWTFTERAQRRLSFDSTGRLTAITDLDGYTTTLSYNGSGQLTAVTDPAGRTLNFGYGSNGAIATVTDPAGRQVNYGYDATGNLTSIRDPAGNVTYYGYDTGHHLTTVTDPRGHTTTNTYDSDGRVTQQVDRANRTTTLAYSVPTAVGSWTVTITDPRNTVTQLGYTDGLLSTETKAVGTSQQAIWSYGYDRTTNGLATVTDPLFHSWSYGYDVAGNQTSACDPLNHCTTRTFNSLNKPTSVTDPTNTTTTNSYDTAGNLLSRSTPLTGTGQTASTTLHYDDPTHPGDVTAVTDPLGKTTRYAYDSYGQRISVSDPLGNTTSYTYTCTPTGPGCRSNIGWVYTSVAPRGNATGANPAEFTTRITRDDDGRALSVTDRLGHTTSSTYDGNGNRIAVTDPNKHTTDYAYDNDDEPTTVTRPDGTTVQTGYDPAGHVTSHTDGANHSTSYTYDAVGHLASTTTPPTAGNPNGITTSYSYDTAGRLATSVDAANQTTSYGYDAASRLTAVSYSDGTVHSVSYSYDPANRRTAITDGTGTTSYSYDSLGRLTDLTDGAGQHTGYGYDLAGNVVSIAYPNGKTVTRTFDDAGRLTAVTDWYSHTTGFGYNPDGALTTISYPNGVTETTSVDAADQTSGITDTGLVPDSVSAASTVSFDYTRDPAGLLTATTATGIPGQTSDSYGHSALDQLTGYTPSTAGSYSYDHADNVTGLADGTSQAYDPADELTAATLTGATTTFGYNPRGDRTTATGPAGTASYGYDQTDRLTSYTSPDGTSSASYTYNGDGLRTAKTVNGATSRFAWDPASDGSLPQLLADGTTSYLYGPGGLPIEQLTATPSISRIATGAQLDTTGTATSLQVTFSAAAQPNDQILLAVNSVAANDPTIPTGYTPVGAYPAPNAGETTTIYRRTATGGETSATIGFTGALSHAKTVLGVIYRGVDPVHPIDTTSAAGTATPTATSITTPSVTTTTAGDQLVLIQSAANNMLPGTWTPPAGMTDRVHLGSATIGSALADQPFPTPGTTGDRIATFSQPAQLEGVLLALQRAPDTYYLTHDQQDSTRLITDPAGHVAGSYSYDPYSRTLNHAGPTTTALQYDGQYNDAETGLYYLRARYYDPSTGQFLTRDPLEAETRASYSYAGNDPVNASDPSGLCNANPLRGSFWTIGNCLSDNTLGWVPVAGQVKSFASCAGAGGTSVYDCAVMNFDPAYYAIEGYYNEWQDAENGCSGWTIFRDGAEAVAGVAATASVAVGGTAAIDSAGFFNGREISIGNDFRVSPFGNRDASNPLARRPHYHRTITGPNGETLPGGSGKWHRPWEKGW